MIPPLSTSAEKIGGKWRPKSPQPSSVFWSRSSLVVTFPSVLCVFLCCAVLFSCRFAANVNMNSSWKPNPKAKPFLPSSAFYHISVPCKRTPLRVQKKGMLSRLIQWSLVILLCITVVINVLFILDTTSKLKDSAGSEDNVATANELPQGNSQVQGKICSRKLCKLWKLSMWSFACYRIGSIWCAQHSLLQMQLSMLWTLECYLHELSGCYDQV